MRECSQLNRRLPQRILGVILDMDVLCDRRVTFGPNSEKEPEKNNKRARSQNGPKNERKQSGKNSARSG